MFEFAPQPGASGPALYESLGQAAAALVSGERDGVANMANLAALIWQFVPELNWAGFYRMVDGELVLGPFIGRPACLRIALQRPPGSDRDAMVALTARMLAAALTPPP